MKENMNKPSISILKPVEIEYPDYFVLEKESKESQDKSKPKSTSSNTTGRRTRKANTDNNSKAESKEPSNRTAKRVMMCNSFFRVMVAGVYDGSFKLSENYESYNPLIQIGYKSGYGYYNFDLERMYKSLAVRFDVKDPKDMPTAAFYAKWLKTNNVIQTDDTTFPRMINGEPVKFINCYLPILQSI